MDILKRTLQRIDQKGYKAYKDIQGQYQFNGFNLHIDYVQGDPFASPSKIRIVIPRNNTAFELKSTNTKQRRIRCEDLVARVVQNQVAGLFGKIKGSGKSGLVMIDAPKQKVIERTAVKLSNDWVTICLSIGLPANGRRVLGTEAHKIFFHIIPDVVRSVYQIKQEEIIPTIHLSDQQQAIRDYIEKHDLVSFIANGAILPRESGISDKPLSKHAIPFKSSKELEVSIPVPHMDKPIKGMGLRKGITLIVGGGYHGKSTLLKAIEHGIYDHIKGDGREFVITDQAAVKVRAEDGRCVTKVDISPFIGQLPYGKLTNAFTTDNASGSTSQAANIIEMIEAGATTLLIDEDTSATNFMIRDARMQALIAKEFEPITPFIDKVNLLKRDKGLSTILVMGGSGDYFNIADVVIKMEEYIPYDVTKEAKRIANDMQVHRKSEGGDTFGMICTRIPLSGSLNSKKGTKNKVSARGRSIIQYGKTDIQLSHIEQLVDDSQTRMIAEILLYMERTHYFDNKKSIEAILNDIEARIEQGGLESMTSHKGHLGDLARPRRFEIAAALNRLRTLRCDSI